MEQWRRERPDLDPSPMGIIGRLHRLADALHTELRPVFAEAGLSDGDFDVLASLRRSGAPYQLTPGELAGTTMVTSGAVGYLAVKYLIRYLATNSLDVFAWYRLALAAATLVWLAVR